MTTASNAPRTVAIVAAGDIPWLGRWRTRTGLDACLHENAAWVRGQAQPDGHLLPALARFVEDDQGRLTVPGHRVPSARVPPGPWRPLSEFLRVQPPASHLPGLRVAPIAWSLVPSDQFRPAGLLVLPFEALARWGLSAPAVRLAPLRFTFADDGRACVIGTPLPPLAAELWWLQENIALPAGWDLPRGVTASLVAASLGLTRSEIVLLHADGSAERLPGEVFVPVTRGALRATARGGGSLPEPEA